MSDFFAKPQYASLRGHSVIVCEDTNNGLRFFNTSYVYPVEFANANIQQGLKLEHYSSDKTLWTGTM